MATTTAGEQATHEAWQAKLRYRVKDWLAANVKVSRVVATYDGSNDDGSIQSVEVDGKRLRSFNDELNDILIDLAVDGGWDWNDSGGGGTITIQRGNPSTVRVEGYHYGPIVEDKMEYAL